MNQAPPILTDRRALQRQRARAREMFLQDLARNEVEDRLAEVNRTFTDPVVVTDFPRVWQGWRCTPDAEVLDLAPGSADLVIHALSLHWANDPIGQLVQCRRALRPDGLFIAILFGGQTLAPLRACLAEAEVAETGGLSPRVLPMGEIRDLGGLLHRAGFALPVADGFLQEILYRDALHLMRDLRAMGEANAMQARLRRPTRRAVLLHAARLYQQSQSRPDGRVAALFELITLTGWAPHESQQKPLRPGSASVRFATALGALELPLPREDG